MEYLMADIFQYADMQKSYYESLGTEHPSIVVGNYDYHENVPYESNLLFKYGDIRRPIFDDFKSKIAFDIACGEGRMVRRMSHFFKRVDGADISSAMIDHARKRTEGSHFYVTNGFNCGLAPTATYDFVYCTISLQHICVAETRDLILKDILRILKPDGKITFQYLFSKHFPLVAEGSLTKSTADTFLQTFRENKHHARWSDNLYEASSTNSGCDVVFGQEDIPFIKQYFYQYFNNVEIYFYDISIGRGGFDRPRVLDETHPNSHINDHYHGTHFAFIHLSDRKV